MGENLRRAFLLIILFCVILNMLSILNWKIHIKVKNVYLDRYYQISDDQNQDTLSHQNFRKGQQSQATNHGIDKVKSQSFVNDLDNQRGFINIYEYADICIDFDSSALLWNTLFPRFPHAATTQKTFYDEKEIDDKKSRRMVGLLYPNATDLYQFRIESKLGCEFRLIEGDVFNKDEIYETFMLHVGIYKQQITNVQNKNIFVKDSKLIRLDKDRVYMIDVIHVFSTEGFFRLLWKRKGEKEFRKVPSNLLAALYKTPQVINYLPNITYPVMKTVKTEVKQKDRRNLFNNLPSVIVKTPKICDYEPSYIPGDFKKDTGVAFVMLDKLYPENKLIDHHHKAGAYDLYIRKETVFKVLHKFMELVGR